jgi:hypothetical protein
MAPALEKEILNHWTTREVPRAASPDWNDAVYSMEE